MAQHSLTIGNVSAADARSDINDAFDTINTLHSGSTAPTSPSTYQLWFDSGNNLLKIYDGAAWTVIGKLDTVNDDFHPVIGDWEITHSGSDLIFTYNGVNTLKLTSGGNLTVTGDITAFGSI